MDYCPFADLVEKSSSGRELSQLVRTTAKKQPVRCGDVYFFDPTPPNPPWADVETPFDTLSGPFFVLPYSSLDMISCSGEIPSIYSRAPTGRLAWIPQLSILADPLRGPQDQHYHDLLFSHTRDHHSLLAAVMMETILRRNEFPEEEIRKGIAAALLHDYAIVAGGDAMKIVDPKAMHEERLIGPLLENKPIKPFLDRYGLSPDEIQGIIKNQGTLGRVLDLVDRLSYTAIDCAKFYECCHNPDLFSRDETIVDVIDKDPSLFDIVFSFRINENEQIYCDDGERLGNFLLLRAIMHRDLYLNPQAQIIEAALLPYLQELYQTVSIDELLRMNHDELYDRLANVMDTDKGFMVTPHLEKELRRRDVQIAECSTEDEAEQERARLLAQDREIIAEFNFLKGFNPSTSLLVQKEKELLPFSEAFPEATARINSVVDQVKSIRIYSGLKN